MAQLPYVRIRVEYTETTTVRPIPQVGDTVLYFAHGSADGTYPAGVGRAAIVTEVDRPGDPHSPVGLCVLNPTGMQFVQHVGFGPEQAGRWDWCPAPEVEVTVEREVTNIQITMPPTPAAPKAQAGPRPDPLRTKRLSPIPLESSPGRPVPDSGYLPRGGRLPTWLQ
ncbi:MAG TPA: hypothetical protein VGE07_00490 [Herpetosiphonaceae bacterium]